MRARNIKPGFFKNEELAELPYEGRLLFIGLWCLADREGRLEDRPKRIKGELFSFDSVDVDKLLNQLASLNLIIRYEVGGLKYIEIPKFSTHQNPHYKENPSIIPPSSTQKPQTSPHMIDTETQGFIPDDRPQNPELALGKTRVSSSMIGGKTGLIPDSLIPDSNTLSHSGKNLNVTTSKKRDYSPEFELAWKAYPQRAGSNDKRKAYQAWNARIKEGNSPQAIIEGIARYGLWCKTTGKIGTESVKQTSSFLGKADPFYFMLDWGTSPRRSPDGIFKAVDPNEPVDKDGYPRPTETCPVSSGWVLHSGNMFHSLSQLLMTFGLAGKFILRKFGMKTICRIPEKICTPLNLTTLSKAY